MSVTAPDTPPIDGLQEKLTALDNVQRATLNILEDFDAERGALGEVQRATLNILEDFDAEKQRLEEVQRASLNILEDFDAEKQRLEEVQHASLNILEDFDAEKVHLGESQSALLNMLEDIDVEKANVGAVNQQLEAANRELEAFSYSVSHDLRAPLRAIDGFSRIVMENHSAGLPEEARQYLARVRENAKQMGELIDDLLSFSRLSRQPLKIQRVEMTGLVRHALEELSAAGEGGRVQISIGDMPAGEGDPALLKQVFVNLLSNALKFTRTRTVPQIEVGSGPEGNEPAWFVRDNGVGFDMRYADKLFGVFQRLHRPEEYEGTGVGLAIVQRIISRHGGRLWAEAEVDKGATFYFTLGGEASHG